MDTWLWDPKGYYYHAASTTYAIPDASGEWAYIPADQFNGTGPSNGTTTNGGMEEKEEGEIDDDVGWGALMEPDSEEGAVKHEAEGKKPVPNLRLVVTESNVLAAGQVISIDTRPGGIQIGRDRCERGGQARIRLKEMAVSKTHATVYYDEGWYVVDQGSTHGTFAPDRLSESKHASKPHLLSHLSTISIGSTTLTAHIHPDWPCNACQLSGDNELKLDDGAEAINPATHSNTPDRSIGIIIINKEEERKREMAALKETYFEAKRAPTRAYQDRAAIRRRMNPDRPDRGNYHERMQEKERSASPERVKPVSVAANMLAAQGWVPGQGLGKKGDGRATPIETEMRAQRAGLGTVAPPVPIQGEDWRKRAKARRYDELRPSI